MAGKSTQSILHLQPASPFLFAAPSRQGIYGREMYETWYKMSSMLVGGLQERLQPIITHRYPLEDFQKGFDVMCAGESGKVILEF
jgi:threonine 3-dehydrogenase